MKNDHHGPAAETVGFLCRWLLLGGAAAMIGMVAWQCLLATVNVSQDIHSRFIVPDCIRRAGRDRVGLCYQPGQVVGRGAATGVPAVLAARQTGPIIMGLIDSPKGFYLYWPACQAGPVQAVCMGTPYGSLAFQRHTSYLLGVPDGRPLTLLDARLAPPRGKTPPPAWQETIAAIARLGEAALFCPDATQAEYEALLVGYRGAGGTLPMLYQPEKMPHLFQRVARDLGRPDRIGMSVVTGDARLADQAAGAGFSVHLIGAPPAAQHGAAQGILHHATLDEFKDSLPAGPIRR